MVLSPCKLKMRQELLESMSPRSWASVHSNDYQISSILYWRIRKAFCIWPRILWNLAFSYPKCDKRFGIAHGFFGNSPTWTMPFLFRNVSGSDLCIYNVYFLLGYRRNKSSKFLYFMFGTFEMFILVIFYVLFTNHQNDL